MQSLNSPRKISETTVELLKQYNFNLDISVFYIFISLTFYVMTGFEIGRPILLINKDYALTPL